MLKKRGFVKFEHVLVVLAFMMAIISLVNLNPTLNPTNTITGFATGDGGEYGAMAAPTFENAVNTSVDFKRNHNFTANITINNTNLSSYIFSTNASGSWVNGSSVGIEGAQQYNASATSNITIAGGSEVCWYYWANDTTGENLSSSNYCFTVANTAPDVTAAAISPASPNSTVDLNCTYTVTDVDDNDVLTPTYNWFKDGAPQSINNQILALGNTTPGDLWNCSVNVSDGTDWDYLASSEVTISDESDPTFTNAVNTSADFKINSNFTANITINNANLSSYLFSTNASGSWVNTSAASISGTQYNASEQATIEVAKGSEVCWYYWTNDTAGNGASSSNYCFNVANTAPVQGTPTVSSSSGNDYETDDITCTASATDADGDDVSYNGSWYKNGVQNSTFDTSPTNYTQGVSTDVSTVNSSLTSVGDNWSCEVRAYDGGDYSSYAMSANLTILAEPAPSRGGGGRLCTNECEAGTRVCRDDSMYICGDFDYDYCVEWAVKACPKGKTCEDGKCVLIPCVEDWVCRGWSPCVDRMQTRECADWNKCGTTEQKPEMQRTCVVEEVKEEELPPEEVEVIEEKPAAVKPSKSKIVIGVLIVLGAIILYMVFKPKPLKKPARRKRAIRKASASEKKAKKKKREI